MTNMFSWCTKLKEIPLLNTSNAQKFEGFLSSASSIEEIPPIDTGSATTMTNMFSRCTKLTTVPILNTSKVTNMTNMFRNCSALSDESLNNILVMCTNATSYTGTKTLKEIGLSSSQATTCTGLSNWAAAEAAGWTTGY